MQQLRIMKYKASKLSDRIVLFLKSIVNARTKYSFSVFSGWSTDNDGNRSHEYEVIAYNMQDVENWLSTAYNEDFLQKATRDGNSPLDLVIEFYATYDETGIVEFDESMIDEESGELKNGYYHQNDYLDIQGQKLTKKDEQYLKSGKYHTSVIDLTSKENQ